MHPHVRTSVVVLLLSIAVASGSEKKQLDWHKGTIVNVARYGSDVSTLPSDIGTRSGPGSVRTQFDIDDGEAVYVVQQISWSHARLNLAKSDNVLFAMDGKDFILETSERKRFKLKLLNVIREPSGRTRNDHSGSVTAQ